MSDLVGGIDRYTCGEDGADEWKFPTSCCQNETIGVRGEDHRAIGYAAFCFERGFPAIHDTLHRLNRVVGELLVGLPFIRTKPEHFVDAIVRNQLIAAEWTTFLGAKQIVQLTAFGAPQSGHSRSQSARSACSSTGLGFFLNQENIIGGCACAGKAEAGFLESRICFVGGQAQIGRVPFCISLLTPRG